ncbi:MAG: cytochrome c [Polyangia bacterium]
MRALASLGLALALALSGCPSRPVSAPTAEHAPAAAECAPPTASSPSGTPGTAASTAVGTASPPLGRILQAMPASLGEGPVYSAAPFPRVPPELPAGDGRALVESFCVACHSLRYLTTQPPLPAKQWAATVDKMVQAYGAVVPDEARAQIVAYLQAHFASEAAGAVKP